VDECFKRVNIHENTVRKFRHFGELISQEEEKLGINVLTLVFKIP
jgi:hypothetical protein